MPRFSGKKARRQAGKAHDVAASTSNQAARFALMKEREEEINSTLAAHLATDPTAPFDVVVAHRGDVAGVLFHEALARQTGQGLPGDVGVFCTDRAHLLTLLETVNPDLAETLRATSVVNVVCFAYQGTTIYTPPTPADPFAAPAAPASGVVNLWPATPPPRSPPRPSASPKSSPCLTRSSPAGSSA